MSDQSVNTTLTADAGPLNAALKSGAQSVAQFAGEAKAASAAQAAASQTTRAALDAQRSAMQQARAEANQLKQAYRTLPMQITDIGTSLVSGMPVWMVAIQQGGQLKDSFGGVKPAADALISTLTPMRVGLGGLAGAAVAVALAYKQGSAEADAYRQAIVMSGNAAGVTMGQIAGMARAVSQTAGTQSQAAAALAQAAATGRVSAANLELVATTAVKMQRATGAAVEDTVAQFAALGKEPVAASKKLNDQYHHLTVEVYEQIKALEKRGEIDAAGELAQKTLAAAMNARTAELMGNLGTMERGWLAVTDAAKWAWDQMLGVGRQGTLQEQLAAAEKQLAEPARRGGNTLQNDERRKAIQQRIEDLRQQIYAEGEVAAAQQASASATTKHIATETERERAAKAASDAYAKVKADIRDRIALMDAELANGGPLNASQRLDLELKKEIAAEGGKISAARMAELRTEAATAVQRQTSITLQQQQLDAQTQAREAAFKTGEEARREADAMEKSNDTLREEVKELGLTGFALVAVQQKRLEDTITIKEQELAKLSLLKVNTMEQVSLERQIEALKERRALLGQREIKRVDQGIEQAMDQQRRAEAEENARRSDALGKSISQGILQGARDGRSIMDVFRRELEDAFERTVLRPMIQPFANEASGLLGNLIGSIAGFFGGGGGGGGGDVPWIAPIKAHGGGTLGVDSFRSGASAPASAWDHAPRYHQGKLGTDEYRAVLQRGESVLTPGQLKAVAGMGAAQSINLTVINNTGTPAQASTRRTSDGGIEVLLSAVKSSIADDVASGNGPVVGALRQRFGLRDSFSTS